nr:immunoglobulin heavy chain junction region [Mus musculus]
FTRQLRNYFDYW